MKTYVIADVHGRSDLLGKALKQIAEWEPEGRYTLVTLGDYVGRGPDAKGVLELLMRGPQSEAKWVHLKGNHEDRMVDQYLLRRPSADWLDGGGRATLRSYGLGKLDKASMMIVNPEHMKWMARLPVYYEDRYRVYVHAGVDEWQELEKQNPLVLMHKVYAEHETEGWRGKHVVHGHEQRDRPAVGRERTNLDGGAWLTGTLWVGVFEDDEQGGPVGLKAVRV